MGHPTSRPDILGIVGAVSEDGGFTNAVYFTSNDAASEGERKDIPPEVLNRGDEMMSLASESWSFWTSRHHGWTHPSSPDPPTSVRPQGFDLS